MQDRQQMMTSCVALTPAVRHADIKLAAAPLGAVPPGQETAKPAGAKSAKKCCAAMSIAMPLKRGPNPAAIRLRQKLAMTEAVARPPGPTVA